ncbi:MAG: thioredoxin domain-containing protein, partial [Bacteroidales bacterium]|nr:thioredoxin domain-containing protein [Bacteroidales bacterium]
MNAHSGSYNHLRDQTSPYLLQHATNPVEWFPWGDEAFEKARQQNKLVLVSIGYAACHWCHVMEKECFSDPEVAALMNKHFVSIKVDREERPDIDHYYMESVQLITGSGGWPLNCFALPDGRPVFGGTYFPPDKWKQVLNLLAQAYRQEPEKLNQQADQLEQGLDQMQITHLSQTLDSFKQDELDQYVQRIRQNLDDENGGLKGAPKFPMPLLYHFLLKYHFETGDESLLEHIQRTLTRMAEGGIYDHLGGGFARYSTDKNWTVPHFEKMLYDNALLASLYSQVYMHTKQDFFRQTAIETLNFMKDEMLSEDFMFYSSIDADSEGGEGRYYTWGRYEIDLALYNDAGIFSDYFGVSEQGNWGEVNILKKNMDIPQLAIKYNQAESKIREVINKGKTLLLNRRKKRTPPPKDQKAITSWNALAIKAFIHGYQATGKREYLRIALSSAENIISRQLESGYRLSRIYAGGQSSVDGFLDDYAYLGDALLEVYQITFDDKWVDWAAKITDYALKQFVDSGSHLLNYARRMDHRLTTNPKELIDAVLPSSNSVFARNLFILGQYFASESYIDRARKMLAATNTMIPRDPSYFANWLSLMTWFVHPPYEIAIVGRKAEEYRSRFENLYHPAIILAGGTHEGNLPILKNRFKLGKTQIYICQGQVCQEPIS